jgi:hypothetical protein
MNDQAPTRAMTVGVWLTIDATLDNAVSNLIDAGHGLDSPEVTRTRGLRERGWAVNRRHPERGLGPVGWPPRGAAFCISLSDDEVSYLIDLLTHGAGITRHLLASEIHASNRQAQERSLVLNQDALDALAEGSAR